MRGVTEFNGKLYVICDKSSAISVFSNGPLFNKLREIVVHGLGHPRDIVSCNVTSQLYIADTFKHSIWQVDLLSNRQSIRFATIPWPPSTLSIKSKRLLITLCNWLLLYGNDGKQLKEIGLPSDMLGDHAVETNRQTYVVSHTSYTEYKRCGLTEIDEVDGITRVIRVFDNPRNNIHIYLVSDNDHVIAAEYNQRNIIVMDSKLELTRVLMTSFDGNPRRMCLSSSRYLYVGCWTRLELTCSIFETFGHNY